MKFGRIALESAEGAILAHATRAGSDMLKKGRILSRADIDRLHAAGLTDVIVAQLEVGDVPEDQAALRLATALAGPGTRVSAAFTGRTNIYAAERGIALIDEERVNAINLIDETVTVATLRPHVVVEPRQMLATIKIIPFAAPDAAVAKTETIARADGPIIKIAPFTNKRIAIVSTQLPTTKPSLLDKNRHVLEQRLHHLSGEIIAETRVAHDETAVAGAIKASLQNGAELVFIYGASAIVDRRDVIPAGITGAGGVIEHFGMPVDPGNLLLLGRVGAVPLVGLPGCARSPKLNGFDWVLERLLADVPVTRNDIMRMGAGGLLGEIHLRPQPRDVAVTAPKAPEIAGLVLAAGQSRRMGENKLLADVDRQAMIVRTVKAVLASSVKPVFVVTGHQHAAIETALKGLPASLIHNPHFANGLSTSLRAGISALPPNTEGALVCLGDMPSVTADQIDRLVAAFDPAESRAICVPTFKGKRGNPVLWSAEFFPEMMTVAGDTGAKHLIGTYAEAICEIEMPDDAVLADIDTPEALANLRAKLR